MPACMQAAALQCNQSLQAREGDTMLVLTRKVGEAITVGEEITIRVLEVKGGLIKLGIDAPKHVTVHRQEVLLRILEENKQAAQKTSVDLSKFSSIFTEKQKKQ